MSYLDMLYLHPCDLFFYEVCPSLWSNNSRVVSLTSPSWSNLEKSSKTYPAKTTWNVQDVSKKVVWIGWWSKSLPWEMVGNNHKNILKQKLVVWSSRWFCVNFELSVINGGCTCKPPLGLFAKCTPPYLITGWWLNQPLWKICSSNWIISPNIGVNVNKSLKPPPSK